MVRDARFWTVHVALNQSLLGRVYFCEHLAPELGWRPEWRRHANEATAIEAVVVAAAEMSATAGRFRQLLGDDSVRQDGERSVVLAGRPTIEIVPVASLEADAADAAKDD